MSIKGIDTKTFTPQAKPYKRGPFTVEVPDGKKKDGETAVRRNVRYKDGLISRPHPSIETMHDIMTYASRTYGNAKAMGTRKLVKMHNEVKKVKKVVDGKEEMVDKKWQYFELSGYTYMTFTEFHDMALSIGSGLRKLGMEPGDRVHLFAATHSNWLGTAHGALSQSMPIVTAYDTLGEEGLTHSMEQTHAKAIYLDPHLLTKLIKPLQKVKDIQYVIYNTSEDVKQDDIKKLQDAHSHLKILSVDELKQLGKENPMEPVKPKAEDLCCIMYTSGSTGAPKGVMLKHKNVVAAVAGVDAIVGDYLGPGDGLLAYLPAAHILEFVFENAVLYWGGTMGYGNPRTLSDVNVRNCKGDIREFKPTILIGVPAVWEQVRKGIVNKVSNGSFVVKNMFWGAMAAKNWLLHTGLPGVGLLDSVVFSKIKDATGGRLRICMNGGGPISKDTQRFISVAIAPMISGYGLTETAAMGVIMDPLSFTTEALGEITGAVEVKLVDFADAGYFSTNSPPQGEIWIRGDSITDGYLDLEKETKEAFTDDGWFKTGDIGEFDRLGQLQIIDRKKNLVKTLNGEYIALEKLESNYRTATVVANICVYASPEKSKPVAIIVPAEPALKKVASENGIQGDGLEDLVHNEKLNAIVLKQLQDAGRKAGLGGIEIIEGLVMSDEEWTPQNGLVTSAQKLNRKEILNKYKKDIDKAYSSS